jgi:hypothetical protein
MNGDTCMYLMMNSRAWTTEAAACGGGKLH